MTRFSNFFLLILAGISFLFMSSVYVVDAPGYEGLFGDSESVPGTLSI